MFKHLPKSRKEAIERGEKTYFTGMPCKHGHLAPKTSYNSTCVTCYEAINKSYYHKNQPELREKLRKDRRSRPEFYLVSEAKGRAKDKGIEHSITADDISVPAHCPVLGIPLLVGREHPKDNNPSIDRIDSSKGYIPGNVIVVSTRANRIKNNSTVEDLRRIYEFYSSFE